MIEINETPPVAASLTIVLRGDDVQEFNNMLYYLYNEELYNRRFEIAYALWKEIA